MPLSTDEIATRLRAALAAEHVDVADESDRHAGHPGARAGGGHYRVTVVSSKFHGRSAIERHRLVYDALGDLVGREIHALALRTLSPEEHAANP